MIKSSRRKKKSSDFEYTVMLHPELMDKIPRIKRAGSWDETTAFIMLDKGYFINGMIYIRTFSSFGYDPQSENHVYLKNLMTYAGFETIDVFDRFDPTKGIRYDGNVYEPLSDNSIIGNELSDAKIKLTEDEISDIKRALNNPDDKESKEILSRYDDSTIEFLSSVEDWGDYILFPITDKNGKADYFKGTAENVEEWNIPQFMIGTPGNTWMQQTIDNGAIEEIAALAAVLGI